MLAYVQAEKAVATGQKYKNKSKQEVQDYRLHSWTAFNLVIKSIIYISELPAYAHSPALQKIMTYTLYKPLIISPNT